MFEQTFGVKGGVPEKLKMADRDRTWAYLKDKDPLDPNPEFRINRNTLYTFTSLRYNFDILHVKDRDYIDLYRCFRYNPFFHE